MLLFKSFFNSIFLFKVFKIIYYAMFYLTEGKPWPFKRGVHRNVPLHTGEKQVFSFVQHEDIVY